MSLSSFSSLLNFAIKQQKDALTFFAASLKNLSVEKKEHIAKLQSEAEKSIKNLETILRENVSEIVMEPFEELNESDYLLQFEGADIWQISLNILEKQRKLFHDGARVINLKEVKRLFEKMEKMISSLISEIK